MAPTRFDRFLLAVAPSWALSRIRARAVAHAMARHYEAASTGRRTENWPRSTGDANTANGPSLLTLRAMSRDMVRNNPWARRGIRVIGANTVGWGIVPKALGTGAARAQELWKRWAETTECDADGRHTFYGIQRIVAETVAQDGEILIRRRWRRPSDGLSIPLQVQLLEADFLDTSKDNIRTQSGGVIIQGVEFNPFGQRVAYWLYEQHPGSNLLGLNGFTSKRYPAEDFIHLFRPDRPGQVRGVSWLAPVLVRLREFDEFEDAVLVKQKIAACLAGFVRDIDGGTPKLGEQSTTDTNVQFLEPGSINTLGPGQEISFSQPPAAGEEGFTLRTLRAIAAGLGTTYEDLTGDYSQVNYSSGRLGRLSHWRNVYDWQWNLLVPHLCEGVWDWAMEAARLGGSIGDLPGADWTPPPMPLIEPDREIRAKLMEVRAGFTTLPEAIREQGRDPEVVFEEAAKTNATLDKLGLTFDSDPRQITQFGMEQPSEYQGKGKEDAPPAKANGANGTMKPAMKPAEMKPPPPPA